MIKINDIVVFLQIHYDIQQKLRWDNYNNFCNRQSSIDTSVDILMTLYIFFFINIKGARSHDVCMYLV